jgi:hypothetical protein
VKKVPSKGRDGAEPKQSKGLGKNANLAAEFSMMTQEAIGLF